MYGVAESEDPNSTGGAPVPIGSEVGFERGEIDKETIENLVTSNIQPRLGPELFQVTEVPYGGKGRIIFVVEVSAGIGDVWQAKDKRYYKRFHYKAEPMEHYEINMVRQRNVGPDLSLGAKTGELCRKYGMSEATFYKWKAKYAGLMLNELKRLRSLEDENRHLKQIVAPAGVGQLVSQGVAGKKLLNPKVRKMAASYPTESLGLSERRARLLTGISPLVYRYKRHGRQAPNYALRGLLIQVRLLVQSPTYHC